MIQSYALFTFLVFWPLTLLPIPLLYATCFYVSSIHIGQQSWHTSQYSDITVVPQTLLCLKIRNYWCVSLRESYIGLLISDHWSNTNFIDCLHASFWTCSLLKWRASTVTPLLIDSSIIWTPGVKTLMSWYVPLWWPYLRGLTVLESVNTDNIQSMKNHVPRQCLIINPTWLKELLASCFTCALHFIVHVRCHVVSYRWRLIRSLELQREKISVDLNSLFIKMQRAFLEFLQGFFATPFQFLNTL